jgi:heptosyltransferase I
MKSGNGISARVPATVCIVRLSAIGDCCHTLAIIRTLQDAWPETKFTWIIGSTEFALLGSIPNIEFFVLDKSKGFNSLRNLHRKLRNRSFDLLLHMHPSMRANIASLQLRADRRLGFDRQRAKDLQWLFCNEQIEAHSRQHVMDSFFGFAEKFQLTQQLLRWDIPMSDQDIKFADQYISGDLPTVVISPCSSMLRGRQLNYRNWLPERYAAVADHAADRWRASVIFTGGNSAAEQTVTKEILSHCKNPPINLVGKTSLHQLLALLSKASVLICPDSGPGHMATAVATPVIGLFASTNPDRAGPYLSREWLVNEYPDALRADCGLSVEDAKWGQRIHSAKAMERIQVGQVTATLDRLLSATAATPPD